MRHVVRKASEMGIKRLYLYTGGARAFYERLGWRYLESEYYEGRTVAIMEIDTDQVAD